MQWRIFVAIMLAMGLAGCDYAPLPSAGGSVPTAASVAQSEAVEVAVRRGQPAQSEVDGTSTILPDINGQVCCVAAVTTGPTMVSGIAINYNGWDTAFISWMVPHFAVASQLAELVPARANAAAVKSLAAGVDAAMSPNYLKMAAMAKAWGQPVPSTDPSAASGHDHGGDDSSGADNAASLTKLSGREFDRKYLQVLVADDKAALAIARATVANCANRQAKALAQHLATYIAAQIALARRMLKEAT